MSRSGYQSARIHVNELLEDGELEEACRELLGIARKYASILHYYNKVYRVPGDPSLLQGDEELCLKYWTIEKKMDTREQLD